LPALLRDRGGGFSWGVRVIDISFGGAGIESTEALDPDHPVVLEVVAPSLWDPLVLRGHIVWSSAGRVGVAFDADDPQALFALFEVLTTNAYE
jgi:hypothetical protein